MTSRFVQIYLLMEKKQEVGSGKNNENEDFEKAFEEFQNETPLNLTDEGDKGEDDPEMAQKIQQQYEKFMNEMKNFQLGGEEGMDDLTNSLSGLLKGLTESLGVEGKQGEDLKNMFSGANGGEGNIEAIAGKLLEVFMNKDLLYAPLVQCRGSYDDFFKKSEGKESEEDMERYKKQYNIICEIILTLDEQPDNKEKLMDLFEKMQDYGQPPAGIASVTLPTGI